MVRSQAFYKRLLLAIPVNFLLLLLLSMSVGICVVLAIVSGIAGAMLSMAFDNLNSSDPAAPRAVARYRREPISTLPRTRHA